MLINQIKVNNQTIDVGSLVRFSSLSCSLFEAELAHIKAATSCLDSIQEENVICAMYLYY